MLSILWSKGFWQLTRRAGSAFPVRKRTFFVIAYTAWFCVLSAVCLLAPPLRGLLVDLFRVPLRAAAAAVLYLLLPFFLARYDWLLIEPETRDETAVRTARQADTLRELIQRRDAARARNDSAALQEAESAIQAACSRFQITKEALDELSIPDTQPRRAVTAPAAYLTLLPVLADGTALFVLLLTQ